VSAVISGKKDARRDTCNRIIKVNHAGEFGAINRSLAASSELIRARQKNAF
jgi:demethoxyubiquinone hydroxylase (CLK1/Coq7/Cat5 family)